MSTNDIPQRKNPSQPNPTSSPDPNPRNPDPANHPDQRQQPDPYPPFREPIETPAKPTHQQGTHPDK